MKNKKKTLSEYLRFARFYWGSDYILESAEISIGTLQGIINGKEPKQPRIIKNLDQFRKENPLDE